MSQIHIMLDLETWGKVPGCDIRSIGACVFDPTLPIVNSDNPFENYWIGDTFYVATDNPTTPHECYHCESCDSEFIGGDVPKYPLTRDPETVQWWSEQTPEAQAAFSNPVDLLEALKQFTAWTVNLLRGASVTELKIWANDPHFDCSILAAAYRAVDLSEPWHYRSPRSQKTITDAAGMTRDDFAPFNHGTAHNALDDAISQARIVCEAYRRLGLQRS